MHALAARQTAGRLSDGDLSRMREANCRFAEAVASSDLDAALDADEELHQIPIAALGNHALDEVIDHFDPLVRRAERARFSSDGHTSIELHERLITLMTAGDAEQAAAVAFEIWHSLPTEAGDDAGTPGQPLSIRDVIGSVLTPPDTVKRHT
jgi:DNA-binding GntR family transcriptional regulator